MSIDRGMDKEDVVHIYNEYYSVIKKKEMMPFSATWIDLEIIILSEVRQRKTISYDITHMWNLIFKKIIQMNLSIKQ